MKSLLRNILCVQSEIAPLVSWAIHLSDPTYLLHCATGGAEALAAISGKPIAAAILALPLPDVMDVAHAMKDRQPELPIILYLDKAVDGLGMIDAIVTDGPSLGGALRAALA